MTLKKVKRLVDERKISELMRYFYCVTYRRGTIDVQGLIRDAKLKGWKQWKKDEMYYIKQYKNINITLHK
jgi:hypothetical protein